MKKKCKICGYVFKDKDEAICPECFTAREDDISCYKYSHDDHCHNSYEDYKKYDKVSNRSDTFNDNSSFIDQMKREENRDKFAKEEQKQADSVYMGSVPLQNNNRSSYTKTAYRGLPNVNAYNQNNKPKKKNSGCLVFVIIILIFGGTCIDKISNFIDKYEPYSDTRENENDDDETDYRYLDEYKLNIGDNDVVNDFIYAESDMVGFYNYKNVKLEYSFILNDNTHSTENMPSALKKLLVCSEDTAEVGELSFPISATVGDEKEYVKIQYLMCRACNKDGDVMSVSKPVYTGQDHTITKSENLSSIFYYDTNAELIEISAYISNGKIGKNYIFRYELNDE